MVASDGFETDVTVNVLPFNGKAPAGVNRRVVRAERRDIRRARQSEAAPCYQRRVRPKRRSRAEVSPSGLPESTSSSRRNQSHPVDRIVLGNHLAILGKVSTRDRSCQTRRPSCWNFTSESVTAPDVPAVKFTAKTGTRAEPEPALEINEPAAGLSEAKLTDKPVAGATTPVPVPVRSTSVAVPVEVVVLIEFTNALVLGPKYPAAGEMPFAAWNSANAALRERTEVTGRSRDRRQISFANQELLESGNMRARRTNGEVAGKVVGRSRSRTDQKTPN